MWTLLLSRASDPPGSFFDRRQLESGQIRVGRSAKTCDLVLPDDQGYVSREHCTISALGLDLFVIDSSVNGVSLNQPGQRIAPNTPVAIRPNDRLLIGDFVITVATEAAGAGFSLAPPPPSFPSSPPSIGGRDSWFDAAPDPIWDAGQQNAAVHEFLGNAMDEFLAPKAGAMPARPPSDFGFGDPLGQAFARPIMADPLPPPADFGIPEDWATAPAGSRAAPPAPPSPPAASFPAAAPSFPPPAGPPAAPPPTYPPAASAPFAPVERTTFAASPPAGASPGQPGPADDPFALPPFTPAPVDPDSWLAGTPPAPPANELPAAAPLHPAALPPAATMTPVASPTEPAGAADPGWAAFFAGAGLEPGEMNLSPDAMHRLGILYRQVVLGLSDLMQDRAAFKDEFRVERTQLSIGKNNPLKHLPPLDAAKVLLGEPLPGFLSTEETVRTAFEDIKKHQLAMLAGVQHALTAVFERLSPGEIEKLIEKAGQKKGLSFWRGIDRWSVYQTVFEALRRDAVSNANGVMSVAFREGYEAFLKSGR